MIEKYYYIECTCIRKTRFPYTVINVGDVLWYNGNASSIEMYVISVLLKDQWRNEGVPEEEIAKRSKELDDNVGRYRYRGLLTSRGHLPFTRRKTSARKYKSLKQAGYIKSSIESAGDFKCEIKEIDVTYTDTGTIIN